MGYQPEKYRIEKWESGYYVFFSGRQRGPFKTFKSAERYIKTTVRINGNQKVVARYDGEGNRI